MHSRRTSVRTLVLAVALVGLTGCTNPLSDDDPPQVAAQDRSGRLLTAAEVKTALPSVASLPNGWGTRKNFLRPKVARTTVKPASCEAFDRIDDGYLRGQHKAYRTFVQPGRGALGVGIASHAEEPPAYDALRKALPDCPRMTIREGKEVTFVTTRALRLPKITGDAVVTRMLMRSGKVVGIYDVVRVRVGHNEIRGDLLTFRGKPQTRALVTAVRNAVLNLS
jgi:hypothetical protein